MSPATATLVEDAIKDVDEATDAVTVVGAVGLSSQTEDQYGTMRHGKAGNPM